MSDAYDRFTRSAHALLLSMGVCFLALCCAAVGYGIKTARHFNTFLSNVDFNLGQMAVSVGEVQDTIANENRSLTQQNQALSSAVGALAAAIGAAKDFLAHTDRSLNDAESGVLPALAGAVQNQDAQLTALEQRADKAVDGLLAAETQLTALLAAGTADVGALKASAAKLDQAIDEANALLVQLDGMAKSGNEMAAIIEVRLRQALAPASLAKSIFMHALGIADPAAQIAAAAK